MPNSCQIPNPTIPQAPTTPIPKKSNPNKEKGLDLSVNE